jgi:hypothetical protein
VRDSSDQANVISQYNERETKEKMRSKKEKKQVDRKERRRDILIDSGLVCRVNEEGDVIGLHAVIQKRE